MWAKLFSILIGLGGLALLWFSLFGKKEKIDSMDLGTTTSFMDFIFELMYMLSPTLIKRVLLFFLGSIALFISVMIFLYG